MDDQSDLIWGVYCLPVKHNGTSRFLKELPMSYDDALALADRFAESNKQWYYVAMRLDSHND